MKHYLLAGFCLCLAPVPVFFFSPVVLSLACLHLFVFSLQFAAFPNGELCTTQCIGVSGDNQGKAALLTAADRIIPPVVASTSDGANWRTARLWLALHFNIGRAGSALTCTPPPPPVVSMGSQ